MNDEEFTRLGSFLHDLAVNRELLEEYLENPVGVLKNSGLACENQLLLLSGDLKGLQEALIVEQGEDATFFVMIWPPMIWWPPHH